MTDKIIKSKISFKELPREIRKDYLVRGTEHFRSKFENEYNHDKFTFLDDYKQYCWLIYYCEDYKYNLCQDTYTKKFYCEVAE